MAQTLTLAAKGLWTSPNDMSQVPAGSMSIARNIDLSRTGLIRPARGYSLLTDFPDKTSKLFFYNDALLAMLLDNTLQYFDGSTAHNLGNISVPSGASSVRMLQFQRNAYFTSSEGIKKLDSLSGTLYNAGVPKGLMITGALSASAGTAIINSMYVAYRYLLGRKDNNGNLVLGGVSDKLTIHNASGGDKNADLRVYLPTGIDTTFFLQLYRSANSTVSAINEELQQCYETPLSSLDLSNGYIDITDVVPDDLLGTTIYTASSQEGLINDNGSGPPLARDLAEYKNCMFYANTERRASFPFTIVSVGGSNGLVAGSTITVSNGVLTETYTGAASENVGAKEFAISASSSLAIRIDETTRSLVNVINRASGFFYAYIVTDETGLPGKVRFEARQLGSPVFSTISNKATAFSPQLSGTPVAAQMATTDAKKNRIMFSKQGIGEAVTAANFFDVGSADNGIVRIIGLRDGLFILTEGGGVYILTGEDAASFVVTPLDLTCNIVAPDSVVTINNLIYGLFEAGIAELSTSGAMYFSEPIQDKIQELYGLALTQARKAFGFGVQTDSKYYLCLPSSSADDPSDYQLIYHLNQKSFAESDYRINCAETSPDGFIHMGMKDSNLVLRERKTFTNDDYAIESQYVTIDSAVGTSLVITAMDISGVEVGDGVYQNNIGLARVVHVDYDTSTVTVDKVLTWDVGLDASILKPVASEWEYNREFAGNPAGLKHFNTCIVLFKQLPIREMYVSYESDYVNGTETIRLAGVGNSSLWGAFAWGAGGWGSSPLPSPRRIGVPRPVARCSALTVRLLHNTVMAGFEVSGVSLVFIPTGTRVAKE